MTINRDQHIKIKKHAMEVLKQYKYDHSQALDFKQRKDIQSVIDRFKAQIKGLSKL